MEKITDKFALYQGDSIEKRKQLPENSVHLEIYSPPFNSMYTYSSSDHDLGNCKTYEEFLQHYEYSIQQSHRILKPGRLSCVHCMDIPVGSNKLIDFPGDIIRLHEKNGFHFWDRKNIWKEPLRVALRTMQNALKHCQLIKDSTMTRGALADYVLVFKKIGENTIPVNHPYGLTDFIGDIKLLYPDELKEYNHLKIKYDTKHTEDKTNRLSQWIWRRYASSDWRDIRANRMVEYKPAKDEKDERHVCPLHLDIIQRLVILYSNIGEIVCDPFSGVGSTVIGSILLNRIGLGIELKNTYFNQSIRNAERALKNNIDSEQNDLFNNNSNGI